MKTVESNFKAFEKVFLLLSKHYLVEDKRLISLQTSTFRG